MAIQKKSLITNLGATKKALVATNVAKAASVSPTTKSMAHHSLAVRSPGKKALAVRHMKSI